MAADGRLPPAPVRVRRSSVSSRSSGLDPARPLVVVMGNTPTNAPYEGRFVERLVEWWEREAAGRLSLLFRPHPRDKQWRERFRSASGKPGVHVQEASYTDFEVLATLLQHAACVVANAGTILLEALVNDRPAVCVLYDEGAPAGESWALKNVIGEHYRELAASDAFYRATRFEEVVAGIERVARCIPTSSPASGSASLARSSARSTGARRSASSTRSSRSWPRPRAADPRACAAEESGEPEEHERRRDGKDEVEVGEEAERVQEHDG